MKFDNKIIEGLLLEMMKDKPKVIEAILNTIDKCEKTETGINKVSSSIVTGSDKNLRKQIKNMSFSIRDMSQSLRQLAILCLIYTMSDSFDSDIGKIGIKLGDGKEFIQQLFKNKFGDFKF